MAGISGACGNLAPRLDIEARRTQACAQHGHCGSPPWRFARWLRPRTPKCRNRSTAFSLSLGGFYPIVDAKVSANGPQVAGTDVDFERDLGLDKHRTLPNVRLEFLVFDSQGFSISGYQYSKSARATLTRDIMFDGNDYDINAFVEAGLRLYTYNAAWHWWFAPVPSDVIGIGLGAAYYDLKGTIDGGLSVNEHSASAHGEAEGSAVAPLLTLGWRHAFSDRLARILRLRRRAQDFGHADRAPAERNARRWSTTCFTISACRWSTAATLWT